MQVRNKPTCLNYKNYELATNPPYYYKTDGTIKESEIQKKLTELGFQSHLFDFKVTDGTKIVGYLVSGYLFDLRCFY